MSWTISLSGNAVMVDGELSEAIQTLAVASQRVKRCRPDDEVSVSCGGSAYSYSGGSGGGANFSVGVTPRAVVEDKIAAPSGEVAGVSVEGQAENAAQVPAETSADAAPAPSPDAPAESEGVVV